MSHASPVGNHIYTAGQGHFVTKSDRATGRQLREQPPKDETQDLAADRDSMCIGTYEMPFPPDASTAVGDFTIIKGVSSLHVATFYDPGWNGA